MTTCRIALANLRYPRTPDESVELAVAAISDAGKTGAIVVAFPERHVPGYPSPSRRTVAVSEEFLASACERVMRAAADAKISVVLGTERFVAGRRPLTALVINADGTVAGWQDKVQLDPSEDPMYMPGNERRVFTAGALTFGIAICHEGWRYPETVRWTARRGAQVVFHPHFHEAESGGFRPTEFCDPRNTFHEKAALCRAAENTVYFATINCATDGSPTTSAVIRPDGTVQCWQPYGAEGLLVADMDLASATGMLAGRWRDVST